MFEGARRITTLVAVIWGVGWCVYLFTWNPYISAYFRVDFPGHTPTRMSEQECNKDDAREYFYSKYTSKGTSVSGALCFKSRVFDGGNKLIPYRMTDNFEEAFDLMRKAEKAGDKELVRKLAADIKGKPTEVSHVWGNEKYSSEVSSYTKEVADSFKLSNSDEDWIDGEVWPARWKSIKEGSLWIIGGVACLYIFSWCFGWIVRGFAGIPLGQDRKSDDM